MKTEHKIYIILIGLIVNMNVFGQWENPANRYMDAYKRFLNAIC